MFFSEGRQIPDGSASAVDYLDRQHVRAYREALEKHIAEHPDGRHEPIVYHQPWYILSSTIDPTTLPDAAFVKFAVDSGGMVDGVEFTPDMPEHFIQEIIRLAREWLFLPALENGKAVPATVTVPVTIDES